jgi:hypothetical protein
VRRWRYHSYVAQADDLIGESGRSLGKEHFVYLAEENVRRCPASEKLTYRFASQEHGPPKYCTR